MTGDAAFDPYKTLQVDPEAEDEVIEAAYRRLARKYHPDVAPGPEAQARMIALNRAWEMLSDPVRRAQVDRARAAAGMRAPQPPPPRPAPGGTPGTPAWRARQAQSAPGHTVRPDGPAPTAGTAPPPPAGAAPRPGGSTQAGDPGWQERTGFDAFADAVAREARTTPGPERVSKDWTAGRTFTGSGYDDSMRTADGYGAAGPPPGSPSGSVLAFGRYAGWSLGEISRVDLEYLEWLERMPIGRAYTDEIDVILRRAGRRRGADADQRDRRGLYRR